MKSVLITGAASGIGKSIAESFSNNNYNVFISDKDQNQGESAAKEINARFIEADLSKLDSTQNLVDQIVKQNNGVDVLINNAGYQHVSPIEEFSYEIWSNMIHVLLTAPFLLIKGLLPNMKTQKWGRIINMGSVHSLIASPYKSAYISAKHGLYGLTKTVALEVGEYGITSNIICPSYVKTPLVDNQIKSQAKHLKISEEEVVSEVFLKHSAIKKIIEPNEVAELALFLASDTAKSITGSSYTIDCGWTAR